MIVAILFAALLMLAVLYYSLRRRSAEVDLMVLRQRLDDADPTRLDQLWSAQGQEFLRAHVDAAAFEEFLRQRNRITRGYLLDILRAASGLIHLGELLWESQDPSLMAEGERLVTEASRVRLLSLRLLARLFVRSLSPGAQFGVLRLPRLELHRARSWDVPQMP